MTRVLLLAAVAAAGLLAARPGLLAARPGLLARLRGPAPPPPAPPWYAGEWRLPDRPPAPFQLPDPGRAAFRLALGPAGDGLTGRLTRPAGRDGWLARTPVEGRPVAAGVVELAFAGDPARRLMVDVGGGRAAVYRLRPEPPRQAAQELVPTDLARHHIKELELERAD